VLCYLRLTRSGVQVAQKGQRGSVLPAYETLRSMVVRMGAEAEKGRDAKPEALLEFAQGDALQAALKIASVGTRASTMWQGRHPLTYSLGAVRHAWQNFGGEPALAYMALHLLSQAAKDVSARRKVRRWCRGQLGTCMHA
jgi:hypothetical protein